MFRAFLLLVAITIGGYGLMAALAVSVSKRPKFPENAQLLEPTVSRAPQWLSVLARFHSGVADDQALTMALEVLQRGQPASDEDGEHAKSRLRQALSTRPYDAELWLALGLLEAQRDPGGPATIESIRMAYLTAPNATALMPVRLDAATRFDALSDPDLRELVLGDVRLMLRPQHGQSEAVRLAYRRASKTGKAFLEDAIGTIDPAFLASLRG